jgi:hypothetical protein
MLLLSDPTSRCGYSRKCCRSSSSSSRVGCWGCACHRGVDQCRRRAPTPPSLQQVPPHIPPSELCPLRFPPPSHPPSRRCALFRCFTQCAAATPQWAEDQQRLATIKPPPRNAAASPVTPGVATLKRTLPRTSPLPPPTQTCRFGKRQKCRRRHRVRQQQQQQLSSSWVQPLPPLPQEVWSQLQARQLQHRHSRLRLRLLPLSLPSWPQAGTPLLLHRRLLPLLVSLGRWFRRLPLFVSPPTTHPRSLPFFDQLSHALPPAVLQI